MTITSWTGAVIAAAFAGAALAGPAAAFPDTGSAGALGSSQQPLPPDTGTSAIDCKTSPAHPEPVLVLHGLGGTSSAVTGQLGPMLAALRGAGHCALQLMYGNAKGTQGAGAVASSARQLAGYVAAVKAKTGAAKVNIVAHSTGGLVANYYAKVLRGAPSVHKIAGLAPISHGTDAAAIAGQFGSSGMSGGPAGVARALPFVRPFVAFALSPGYVDVLSGSEAVCAVERGGITQPGIGYFVLATKSDTVVTPAGKASFIQEPGVVNAYYEDLFPASATVSHPTLPMAPAAIGWVLQRLA